MPDREKRVPDVRFDILKEPLLKGPPAHSWDTENPSIRGCTKRTTRTTEMKPLREVWMSCTKDTVKAGDSYFVLNPAAVRKPMEIKE